MKEMTIDAVVEKIADVTDFIDEQLEKYDCPKKTQMQIDIAVDELFGNIARYAYPSKKGMVTVRMEVDGRRQEASITFIDSGIPYDPLKKEDPDVTLSAEERSIGGLGIYIVKKSMDAVIYEYKDGQNILCIKKNFKE
jgi:anti-sigma regulatory factor (Ser/Thr protein kinase)